MNNMLEEILERLFMQAMIDPAYRPKFLEQLLTANVYCIGTAHKPEDESGVVKLNLNTGDNTQLKTWSDDTYTCVIPFFTSLEEMKLAIFNEEQFVYLPKYYLV